MRALLPTTLGESTCPSTLHSNGSENLEGNEENNEEDENVFQEDQCIPTQEFSIPLKVFTHCSLKVVVRIPSHMAA
jgi:hypothetical protein